MLTVPMYGCASQANLGPLATDREQVLSAACALNMETRCGGFFFPLATL